MKNILRIHKKLKSSKLFGTIKETYPTLYYPMNETNGVVAFNYGSLGNIANGTYYAYPIVSTGNTPAPGGGYAPEFTSACATCYAPTSQVNPGFDGQLGTVGIWYRISASSLWTDGLNHRLFNITDLISENVVSIQKTTTDNTLAWTYIANNTTKEVTSTGFADTVPRWNFGAITFSLAADEMKAYLNGTQVGSTQTGLGTYVPGSVFTYRIGSFGALGGQEWAGWLSHFAIWKRVLTQGELANIYKEGVL